MTSTLMARRRLGQYYTPALVAEVVADWAIRTPDTRVLEPGFGHCAFMCSSMEALRRRGSVTAARQVCGVDVDPSSLEHLGPLFAEGAQSGQFLLQDFLTTVPADFGGVLFDVVIGNPPYVRHHQMDALTKHLVSKVLDDSGLGVSLRASTWAAFVLHSLGFLNHGGRLALVLPGAFLHAEYAKPILKCLTDSFGLVRILLVEERLFSDTEEESVVVLASDYGESSNSAVLANIGSTEELRRAVSSDDGFTSISTDGPKRDWGLLAGFIARDTLSLLSDLADTGRLVRLGEFAEIRLGVVTGANKFFVLSEQSRLQWGLSPEHFVPICSRANQLRGVCQDGLAGVEQRSPMLLLKVDGSVCDEALYAYIKWGEEQGFHLRHKCAIRKPWYVLRDVWIPEAFLPYMSSSWPRIVRNSGLVTCTNTIHRLYFSEPHPVGLWRRLAIASTTSIAHLTAELTGCSYGGGVLKLEPGQAREWMLPVSRMSNSDSLYAEVNSLLRDGFVERATEVADDALLETEIGLSKRDISGIRTARDWLRSRRLGRRLVEDVGDSNLPRSACGQP